MNDTHDSVIRSHRMKGDVLIVELEGDIDLQHSLAFQKQISSLIDRAARGLVFDLTDVPYMDSSGVASLVKVLSSCRKQEMEMALAGLNPRVRGIFEITRLDKVFRMYDTVEKALQEL
ncbi:MAG: STAS domain-containing protein [Phycisphaerae bacterium]